MTSGKPQTIKELYTAGRRLLEPVAFSGCNPDFEAKCLIEHFIGISYSRLPLCWENTITDEQTTKFMNAVQLRLSGEPLQYILGEWEFYGLKFKVGRGVLIPRPETELLVDTALAAGGRQACYKQVLDLCAGSGCVAVSIAKERPMWQVAALELSQDAFAYMEKNISINCTKNVNAVFGDVFYPPDEITNKKYDIITANPPYIPLGQLAELQGEVKLEPHMALFGGADGLDFYRRLPLIYKELLNTQAILAFEIGYDQGLAVSEIMKGAGYINVEIKKDLEGKDRVVTGLIV